MADFTVTGVSVSLAGIQQALNGARGPVALSIRSMTRDAAVIGQRIANAELGKHPLDKPRTGRYAKNFRTIQVQDGASEIRNDTPYADIIERGSKKKNYKIRARRVTYLRFTDRQGRKRVEKVVRHPGNFAKNILWRATMEALNKSATIKRVS